MSDFTIEQLEALKEGTTPGPWGAMTTGVAGGDHWYVCDLSESLALIAANDGEDEEVRGPNARLMAAAPGLVDALIAEKRAHQKLRAEIEEVLDVVKHKMWLHDDEGQFPEAVQLGSYVTAQLARILEATDE